MSYGSTNKPSGKSDSANHSASSKTITSPKIRYGGINEKDPIAALFLATGTAPVQACDHYFFVCRYGSGLAEVSMVLSDGTPQCDKIVKEKSYRIGNRTFPYSSRRFRFVMHEDEEDTLYYRGRRCAKL